MSVTAQLIRCQSYNTLPTSEHLPRPFDINIHIFYECYVGLGMVARPLGLWAWVGAHPIQYLCPPALQKPARAQDGGWEALYISIEMLVFNWDLLDGGNLCAGLRFV